MANCRVGRIIPPRGGGAAIRLRPAGERPAFPSDVRAIIEAHELELDQLRRDLAEARRLTVAVADRLVTVVECLSRVAERKDRRGA